MKRTADQNIRFHKLINLLGIDMEEKAELVYEVSNGETRSSAGLDYNEMSRLISHLQNKANAIKQDEPANKMRRKICSMFHELRYELPSGILDYARINEWMLKFSYQHKLLNAYTIEELPRLVSQVENMLTKQYK